MSGHRNAGLSTLCAVLVASPLAGCASTERQLLESQIDLHNQAIASSKATLAQLQTAGGGPGTYQVRVFIADRVLNDALKVIDNYQLNASGDAGTKITLKSVRFSHYGTLPAASIDAEAVRGQLAVAVKATAVLIPTSKAGEFELRVLSFVPRAQWSWFEVTKAKFVRDLLALEVDKLSKQMPRVMLPIERDFALGGPATTQHVRFQTSDHPSHLNVDVTLPATTLRGQLKDVRYYFVREGIYVFGAVQ